MNKAQLIEALAERLGDKKTASQAVENVVDLIVRNVNKGEKVNITGFGVFEKRARAARTARNPRTGEAVKVKKTNVPAFRAGTQFKEVVGGSRKLPRATAVKSGTTSRSTKSTGTRGTTAKATTTRGGTAAKSTRSTSKTGTKATASKASTSKAASTKAATTKARTSKASTSKASTAKAAPKAATKSTTKAAPKKATTAKASTAKTTRPAAKKSTTTRKTTKK